MPKGPRCAQRVFSNCPVALEQDACVVSDYGIQKSIINFERHVRSDVFLRDHSRGIVQKVTALSYLSFQLGVHLKQHTLDVIQFVFMCLVVHSDLLCGVKETAHTQKGAFGDFGQCTKHIM